MIPGVLVVVGGCETFQKQRGIFRFFFDATVKSQKKLSLHLFVGQYRYFSLALLTQAPFLQKGAEVREK